MLPQSMSDTNDPWEVINFELQLFNKLSCDWKNGYGMLYDISQYAFSDNFYSHLSINLLMAILVTAYHNTKWLPK